MLNSHVEIFFIDKITPKASKCTTIEVPPWLIKGKGTPTTGIIPITINTLIKINKTKIKPKELQVILSKLVSENN